MNTLNLLAPWFIYANQLCAMFDEDPEVTVNYDDEEKLITIYVESEEKADAIGQLLPAEKQFGNVTVNIKVVPSNIAEPTKMALFKTAFKGNPAVAFTDTVVAFGQELNFIVFEPEVVQYLSDDAGDIFGLESTLYENLARDIFGDTENIFFCTDLAEKPTV